GAQAIEHAAQAEQVAALVDRPIGSLFRGHVSGRAGDDAAQRYLRRVVGSTGQAEIENLDASSGQWAVGSGQSRPLSPDWNRKPGGEAGSSGFFAAHYPLPTFHCFEPDVRRLDV